VYKRQQSKIDNEESEAGNPKVGKDAIFGQDCIPKLSRFKRSCRPEGSDSRFAHAEIRKLLSELGSFSSGKDTSLGQLRMLRS
jgi:hypothetical protein